MDRKPARKPAITHAILKQCHMEISGDNAYKFIRTCLSHHSESRRRETARMFVETGEGRPVVQREATRHRVLPLFYRTLEELLGDALPASLSDEIERHRRGVQIHNTFLVQELGRIVRHFDDHEFPFLTFKGPVLAQVAYGDLATRRFDDLDLVVPQTRFKEAERLLQHLGYDETASRKQLSGWRAALGRHLDGQWQFMRGSIFAVDLHTRIVTSGYSFPAGIHPFWDRSTEIQVFDNVVVQGLSSEDRILILSYNGIKNQWRRLRYVTDIAHSLSRATDLNWPLLIERAQELKATRVLKLGLYMTHDVLGVRLPDDIQSWIDDRVVEDVASRMQKYLRSRHQVSSLSFGERVRLQLMMKDTVGGQIRYCVHSLLRHLWSDLVRS